jgi:raffinose/stachyose/melibiose transport system permease protein
VIYPLFFVLMTSIKDNIDFIKNPLGFTPPRPANYVDAWKLGRVGQYFFNSVVVTFFTLILQIIIISLASYSLGKLKPWGYGIILGVILMMMFVTAEMTTVPNYMTMHSLGLLNTRLGLIIPYTAGGLVMGTFILTNFIRELPKELDDAALIDGAGVFQIMTRVDLPLVLPALATLVIFNFNGVWSEFFWALITINDESLKTLPLGLINFQSQFSSNYGVLCAGLTILTVPVVVMYLFFSKYFIANISAGALKG